MTDRPRAADDAGWFLPALTLLLVALKLTGVIDWSWWWVWAPLWGPVALVLAVFAVLSLIALAMVAVERAGRS